VLKRLRMITTPVPAVDAYPRVVSGVDLDLIPSPTN
jgi:hypothetical protein